MERVPPDTVCSREICVWHIPPRMLAVGRVGLGEAIVKEKLVGATGMNVHPVEHPPSLLIFVETLVEKVPQIPSARGVPLADDGGDPRHRIGVLGVVLSRVAQERDEIPCGDITEPHYDRIFRLVAELVDAVVAEAL